MCHRLLSPLFFQASMPIPIPTSQVCMSQAKLQCELESQMYMAPCFLPPFSPVTVAQVIGVAFCKISLSSPPSQLLPWCLQIMALRLMLGAMLLTLAVSSTLKESVMMYKATKKWQPNHYMQLFVKDGILYFLSYICLPLPFPSLTFTTITFSHPCYSQLLPKQN